MLKTKFSALPAFILTLFIYSCFGTDKYEKKKVANKTSIPQKEDTLSNEIQCAIAIDDKQFVMPADSVSTGYTASDSSLRVTIKGLETGHLVITIPNLLKGPCKFPTGYRSTINNVSGSNGFEFWPTVDLYNYDVAGTNFNNLFDEQHERVFTDDALEITALHKVAEDIPNNRVSYLLKGKVHTTIFKSADELSDMESNKKYTVKGKFVVQAKIHF